MVYLTAQLVLSSIVLIALWCLGSLVIQIYREAGVKRLFCWTLVTAMVLWGYVGFMELMRV